MGSRIDARTAERYRSLLLEEIEYLGQVIGSANPLEGSSGADFLSTAEEYLSTLCTDTSLFHEEVNEPSFKY